MTTSNSDPNDLYARALASIAQYERQAALRVTKLGPQIRAALRLAGVTFVRADYDGVGDSGSFEGFAFDGVGQSDLSAAIPEALRSQVEGYFYDLLEVRHGGWENNDGAYGEFIWDVERNHLAHTHHMRFTDTSTESYDNLDDIAARVGGAS